MEAGGGCGEDAAESTGFARVRARAWGIGGVGGGGDGEPLGFGLSDGSPGPSYLWVN